MRTKAVAVRIQAVFAPFSPSLAKVVDGNNTASAAIFQIGLLIAFPCFFLDAQFMHKMINPLPKTFA
jgi:hypothetical protein